MASATQLNPVGVSFSSCLAQSKAQTLGKGRVGSQSLVQKMIMQIVEHGEVRATHYKMGQDNAGELQMGAN